MLKKKELIGLDLVIDLATTKLLDFEPGTPEYEKILVDLERLKKLADKKAEPIGKKDWLMAFTNILGIGLIVRHEHFNVITSKAVGFVKTLR